MSDLVHSTELEEHLLGCMLSDPAVAVNDFIAHYPPGRDVFLDIRNQTFFDALSRLVDAGEHIDAATMAEWLKRNKLLNTCGSYAHIGKLFNTVLPLGLMDGYAKQLMDLYMSRRLVMFADEARKLGMDRRGLEGVDEAQKELASISELAVRNDEAELKPLVKDALQRLEDAGRRGHRQGLDTGLIDLDKILLGMRPGHLVVIAARPSKGKTSLAMNIVEHLAVGCNTPIGVFSLEMSREELVDRLLSSVSRTPLTNFMPDKATEKDFHALMTASVKVCQATIRIVDTGGLNVVTLRAMARRMKQRHKIELLVVDYIQLMSGGNGKESRTQEVSEISRGLKALAKELRIPVIALSQLNRQSETENRLPRLSDLRESGSIEQDADVVLMIHDENDDDSTNVRDVSLLVRKNRGGATGRVTARFIRDITRFENAAISTPPF